MEAIVVELGRRICTVDTGHDTAELPIGGSVGGRGRLFVGDRVECDTDEHGTPIRVSMIHPRASLLRRPAIANVGQMVVVISCKAPPLDLVTLDRCLFSAAVSELTGVIVFNKADLLDSSEHAGLQEICVVYRSLGYTVLFASAASGLGIDELGRVCESKISCLAGPTGVGKSELMGRLFPHREFRTSEVSAHTERGTHTTTAPSLVRIITHGYIADTPGFSFIELPVVPAESVMQYFPELAPMIGTCRFNNCMHLDEPDCRVRQRAEAGEIAGWRYESYVKFCGEMSDAGKSQYR